MSVMPQVLVVDDDPHIRQLLVFAFQKAGLTAREAEDGEAALAAIAAEAPDLVVLDINMPKLDGLEVCRRIRAQGDLPILFLSSRDDEIDRVLGIELGGDDYVVKPFSPREVTARAQAILRRARKPAEAAAPQGLLKHARLSLDPEAWVARWDEAEVPLTVTEFQILRTLIGGPTRVFSRDALIDKVHGPGFAITDRTIDSHIRNLRAKFARAGGGDVVETRAGVGYRLGPCVGGKA
jgi:two-component system OmpR family response regulator